MADRLSQDAVEALAQGAAKARVSQHATETLEQGTTNARLSQHAIEVLYLPPVGKDHVSQLAVETVTPTGVTYQVRLSQDAVEVLTPSPAESVGNRLSQAALEALEQNPSPVSSLSGVIQSQTTLETLRQPTPIFAELSQITLEVLRPYGKDLYVWWRF